ncbi:hypothetical protein OAL53_04500, partial [Akkermansiaceae bacterium]|nr:hypothetical protein [Akkermansiaceae bacterium]
ITTQGNPWSVVESPSMTTIEFGSEARMKLATKINRVKTKVFIREFQLGKGMFFMDLFISSLNSAQD